MTQSKDTSRPNHPDKNANYWKVLNAAIALDIRHGHQKWTITQLSKRSGISRTLIYYYFGTSKGEILRNALTTIGNEILGLSQERQELWNQGKIAESVLISRQFLESNPAILYFYLYNRALENDIGKEIRKKEVEFQRKISQFFPHLDTITHQSLFAFFLGIASVGNLSPEAIHRSFEIIHSGIGQAQKAD